MNVVSEPGVEDLTAIDRTVVSHARFLEVRERRMRVRAALTRQQPDAASPREADPKVTAVAGAGHTRRDAPGTLEPGAL